LREAKSRDLIDDRKVMGRADIRPTFCVVAVDANCDLADWQT